MTTDERFLAALETWLEDEAAPTAPGYVDEIIGRARDTRQHPSWASVERWLPQLRPVRSRATAIPTGARVLAVVALVLALILAAVGTAGRPDRASPFGLARPGQIVMASLTTIMTAAPDGTDVHVLLPAPDGVESLSMSPDGTKLAYRSLGPTTGAPTILVLHLATGEIVDISPEEPIDVVADPIAWSPDSTRIATAMSPEGDEPLAVFAVDGSGGVALGRASTSERTNATAPAWSPDGETIAFLGQRPGADEAGLFVIGVRSANERLVAVTRSFDEAGGPSWEPRQDRSRILYVRADGSIAVIDIDSGFEDVLVSRTNASSQWPTWSPDGNRVAWFDDGLLVAEVAQRRTGRIPTRRADISSGCHDGAVAAVTSACGQPVWSPDGRWIVVPDARRDAIVAISVDGARPAIPIPLPDASDLTAVGSVTWQRLAP